MLDKASERTFKKKEVEKQENKQNETGALNMKQKSETNQIKVKYPHKSSCF